MPIEARCPQCLFLSHQLGQPTPCLLHVSLPANEPEPAHDLDYDEPYAFGQRRPTVDQPGPFTLRQYVRLQLLRSRLEADPSPLDAAAPSAQVGSLSRR
jgi:hypothetical protein